MKDIRKNADDDEWSLNDLIRVACDLKLLPHKNENAIHLVLRGTLHAHIPHTRCGVRTRHGPCASNLQAPALLLWVTSREDCDRRTAADVDHLTHFHTLPPFHSVGSLAEPARKQLLRFWRCKDEVGRAQDLARFGRRHEVIHHIVVGVTT